MNLLNPSLMDKFDVTSVKLEGKNLIEASAGTGKTFSIGILFLRLILEKKLQADQVLMVTFTDAAVAELKERVWKFVREAYEYAQSPNLEIDSVIKGIVDRSLAKDAGQTLQALKDATVLLDETSIYTIHGFCNRTLGEFAFETQQLFEKEMLKDETSWITFTLNEFWRDKIATLQREELGVLYQSGFSRERLLSIAKTVVGGRKFEMSPYSLLGSWLEEYEDMQQALEEQFESIRTFVISNTDHFVEIHNKSRKKSGKPFENNLDNPEGIAEEVLQIINGKHPTVSSSAKDASVVKEVFEESIQVIDSLNQKINELTSFICSGIYNDAAQYVCERLSELKREKSLQSFDDLILNVQNTLLGKNNERLVNGLRRKYKAVFIDEFQDTDAKQYNIFHEAFRRDDNETIMFCIGDPKQSIYAFRQADLETYKLAREGSSCYTMATNFRSTQNYIAAMNHLFKLEGDTFFIDPKIKYSDVDAAPTVTKLGELLSDGRPVKALTICKAKNKDEQYKAILLQILELLNKGKINGRAVKPNDFGVIVRTKIDGRKILDLLSENNVPATIVSDQKVLEGETAQLVEYVLWSILEPSRANINRVLISKLCQFPVDKLQLTNPANLIQEFQFLAQVYEEKGVYNALKLFAEKFKIIPRLLNSNTNGQRMLSDYFQIVEICHEHVLDTNDDLEQLLLWLKNQREGNSVEDKDEYQQRIESDDEAVNITTIHGSKGLAFNIVLTESMQLSETISSSAKTIEYQNPNSKAYAFTANVEDEEKREWSEEQMRKENRRLFYVAMTRAVYKSIVVTSKGVSKAFFNTFVNQLAAQELEHTEVFDFDQDQVLPNYILQEEVFDQNAKSLSEVPDFKASWSISSYSSLATKGSGHTPHISGEGLQNYDKFIFNDMPRGTGLGNFLHYLFESIEFTNAKYYPEWIDKGQALYGAKIVPEELKPQYLALIDHVLHTKLNVGGKEYRLSEIPKQDRLVEMEFNFLSNNFDLEALKASVPQSISVQRKQVNGFLNGFIDLVYRYDGQYFILDWKSNFIGDSVSDYSADKLQQAMTDANYHLQYFIYTIALVRYLNAQSTDFDYEKDFGGVQYVFLRGCRKDNSEGIFYYKPDFKAIQPFL